jgi:hypothetical protein
VTEGEKARLVAWSNELKAVHGRLREAFRVTQAAVKAGEPSRRPADELLMFCHGFCAALTGHHEGEDGELFPAIAAAHPDLAPTLRKLEQDHSMIAHLIAALEAAAERGVPPIELNTHLKGIAAIMESHFRYEERELHTVLTTLALTAAPSDVLGPL